MHKSVLAALGAASMLFAAPTLAQQIPPNPSDDKPGQPAAAPSQPELTALKLVPGDAATGEAVANNSRGDTSHRSVEVNGEISSLEGYSIDLERMSIKGLYRKGPHHVRK